MCGCILYLGNYGDSNHAFGSSLGKRKNTWAIAHHHHITWQRHVGTSLPEAEIARTGLSPASVRDSTPRTTSSATGDTIRAHTESNCYSRAPGDHQPLWTEAAVEIEALQYSATTCKANWQICWIYCLKVGFPRFAPIIWPHPLFLGVNSERTEWYSQVLSSTGTSRLIRKRNTK